MNPCKTCKHAGPGHIRWSAHFRSCTHPDVSVFEEGEIIFGLEYHQEARDCGYFDWPYNYDPNALISCKGFEEGEAL